MRSWCERPWSCPTAGPSPTTTSATRAARRSCTSTAPPTPGSAAPPTTAAAAPGCGCWPSTGPASATATCDPGATLTSLGDDLARLLDAVGGRAGASCSAGPAVASPRSARRRRTLSAPRLAALGLIGTLPPAEAYDDPEVLGALGDGRRAFAEIAREVPAAGAGGRGGAVPRPEPDRRGDRPRPRARAGRRGRAAPSWPAPGRRRGAGRRAAWRACSTAAQGLADDIERQLERGLDLTADHLPRAHVPRLARRDLARRRWAPGSSPGCPNAVLDLTPDAGHHLLFPRWRGILRALRRDAGFSERPPGSLIGCSTDAGGRASRRASSPSGPTSAAPASPPTTSPPRAWSSRRPRRSPSPTARCVPGSSCSCCARCPTCSTAPSPRPPAPPVPAAPSSTP